ncbi:hypothetical protein BH09ACT8_BH09ACT8_22970 [soil metagenome]
MSRWNQKSHRLTRRVHEEEQSPRTADEGACESTGGDSSAPAGVSAGAEQLRVASFGRLDNGLRQASDWYLWGTYLSERQWGTVREDYSADGHAWEYFPHDHARSRAYRWGEDGLAGFSDIEQRLCLSIALWNGVDAILKERAFGLTGDEGNHGEDVKERWWCVPPATLPRRSGGRRSALVHPGGCPDDGGGLGRPVGPSGRHAGRRRHRP